LRITDLTGNVPENRTNCGDSLPCEASGHKKRKERDKKCDFPHRAMGAIFERALGSFEPAAKCDEGYRRDGLDL
jgi:hypothetical protein